VNNLEWYDDAESERTWKIIVVDYFKVVSQPLALGSLGKPENSESGQPVSATRIASPTS
jgi:hypothetical protein